MIKLQGQKGLAQKIKKIQKLYPEAVATALYQEGLVLDGMVVKDIPVDTGRLRASHYVTEPMGVYDPVVEVGVGTEYAPYVHERTELYHKVGKAKFLQDNVEKILPDYPKHILQFARRAVTSGNYVRSLGKAPTRPQTREEWEGGSD